MRASRQPETVIPISCGRQGYKNPAGSETVASYQMELRGTRENQSIYQKKSLEKFSGIGGDKPIDGKELRNHTLVVGLLHNTDEVL